MSRRFSSAVGLFLLVLLGGPLAAQSTKESLLLKGHEGALRSLAYSPDGKLLASGAGRGNKLSGELKVWDTSTGKELHSFEVPNADVFLVAFNPDGSRIISSGDDGFSIWSVQSGKREIHVRKITVQAVQFSPDGKRLAVLDNSGAICVWSVSTGKELLTIKGKYGGSAAIAFSPDGKQIARSAGNEASTYDAETGTEVRKYEGYRGIISHLIFTPDGGNLLATGAPIGASDVAGNSVKVWATATGKTVADVGPLKNVDAVLRPALLADGKRLAGWASPKETLHIWDIETGKEVGDAITTPKGVHGCVLRPDGKQIAAGYLSDQTIKLLDVNLGK